MDSGNEHVCIPEVASQPDQNNESWFRRLVGAISDIILIIDKDGTFVRIDAQQDPIYTFEARFTGQSLADVYNISVSNKLIKNVRLSLKSRKTCNIEYNILDGEERWFSGAITPMTHDLAVCVLREITDLKSAQGKLEAQIIRLEEKIATLNLLIDKMKVV